MLARLKKAFRKPDSAIFIFRLPDVKVTKDCDGDQGRVCRFKSTMPFFRQWVSTTFMFLTASRQHLPYRLTRMPPVYPFLCSQVLSQPSKFPSVLPHIYILDIILFLSYKDVGKLIFQPSTPIPFFTPNILQVRYGPIVLSTLSRRLSQRSIRHRPFIPTTGTLIVYILYTALYTIRTVSGKPKQYQATILWFFYLLQIFR